MAMTKISPHFTLREVTTTQTGIDNSIHPNDLPAVKHTAEQMERVRTVLRNNPILINSWYRNDKVNKAVGGVPNSAHRLGYAVDFRCPGFGSVTEICRAIRDSDIEFDQLIWEYGRWVHISFDPRNRNQLLKIDTGTGYLPGIP